MMQHRLKRLGPQLAIATAAFLVLAGCEIFSGPPAEATPRERALDWLLRYQPLQVAAEQALDSPLLADKPGVRQAIGAATSAATAAVFAYDDATRGCRHDATSGTILLVEGRECNVDKAKVLVPVIREALLSVQTGLLVNGFDPPPAVQ